MLRPVLDPVVEKFKRANKNNKEAIVESNESEQGSKVGQAVPASELGLTSQDWDATVEVEGFLDQPFAIKQTIEHGSKAGDVAGQVSGAQSLIMMHDLMQSCDEDAPLHVFSIPTTASLKDRERKEERRSANDLCYMISVARAVLKEEIESRFFVARPSNARLVQCYMSKQKPISMYLPHRMCELAKTVYAEWLRRAAGIAGVAIRSSPRKKQKSSSSGGVFRSSTWASDTRGPVDRDNEAVEFDAVTDEMKRWRELPDDRIAEFVDDQGLINEFALFWKLRESFPLHYIVFKQTAVHLPQEANVEEVFSTAGMLADPNLYVTHLSRLVMITRNKKAFKPNWGAILKKYMMKFSKAGQLDFEEETLGLQTEGDDCHQYY